MTHRLKKRDAHAERQKTRTLYGQRQKKRIKCELGFRDILVMAYTKVMVIIVITINKKPLKLYFNQYNVLILL